MALNNCALRVLRGPVSLPISMCVCASSHTDGHSNCFAGGCLFTDNTEHYFYIPAEDYSSAKSVYDKNWIYEWKESFYEILSII